jgi:hypothetical protein
MKPTNLKTPKSHVLPVAVALGLCLALFAWIAGSASADGAPPEPTPTATTLECAPASVEAGQSVRCTATVSGLIGASDGEVLFKADDPASGSFSPGICKPSIGEKASPATCSVDYVPAEGSSGIQLLRAHYSGDGANAASEGDFLLAVLPPAGGGGGGNPDGTGDRGGKAVRRPSTRSLKAKARPRRHHRCRVSCRQFRTAAHLNRQR